MFVAETTPPLLKTRDSILNVEIELVERTIQVVANLSGLKHLDHSIPIRGLNLSTLIELVNLTLKPVIQSLLPVDEVGFKLGENLRALDRDDIKDNLEICGRCIIQTNEFLQKQLENDISYSDHHQVLVYSMGENQFLEDSYERCKKMGFTHVLYREFSCGFDSKERHWQGEINCFSPDELMNFIVENKIKRIISINMYYVQFLAQHYGVMIQTVFEKLGLEYTIVDWDIYAINDRLGLNKLVYDHSEMQRFDIFPSIQRAWNKLLGFESTHYYCVSLVGESNQNVSKGKESWLLNDDYSVLAAGHARIETLLEANRMEKVLAVWNEFSMSEVFNDFQLWFYSASSYLLQYLRRPTSRKLELWAKLVQLHFDGITLLKYEVLDQLNTERDVYLYGDEGWAKLFPQYYTGEHLGKKQLWERLSSKKYLNLQFNNVFSYYECNPVCCDALSCGVPFLGLPALVKEPEEQALSSLEFCSGQEMNQKVGDFNAYLNNEELEKAINEYRRKTQAFRNNTVAQLVLVGDEQSEVVSKDFRDKSMAFDDFSELYQKSSKMLIEPYIEIHREEMEQFFNWFERGSVGSYAESEYSQRGYVKVLQGLKQS